MTSTSFDCCDLFDESGCFMHVTIDIYFLNFNFDLLFWISVNFYTLPGKINTPDSTLLAPPLFPFFPFLVS